MFDPSAEYAFYGHELVLEAVAEIQPDGRVRVRFLGPDGEEDEGHITFRAGFFEAIASATRAGEAAA